MTKSKRIVAYDDHADREPGRVIVDGVPDVLGVPMFEKDIWS